MTGQHLKEGPALTPEIMRNSQPAAPVGDWNRVSPPGGGLSGTVGDNMPGRGDEGLGSFAGPEAAASFRNDVPGAAAEAAPGRRGGAPAAGTAGGTGGAGAGDFAAAGGGQGLAVRDVDVDMFAAREGPPASGELEPELPLGA
eukprot:gene8053-8248_t